MNLTRPCGENNNHSSEGAAQYCTWNTRYVQSALDWLRALGEDVLDEDVARLSPLKFGHINFLGRFQFELAEDLAAGALRALRDPDSIDEFEAAWVE